MIGGLILACSILLGYVIDLELWQGISVSLLCGSAYLTGRRYRDETMEKDISRGLWNSHSNDSIQRH